MQLNVFTPSKMILCNTAMLAQDMLMVVREDNTHNSKLVKETSHLVKTSTP